MSFIIFAWIACVIYALEILLSKFIAKYHIKNIWLYIFFWSLLIAIFTTIISVFNGAGLPKELPVLLTTTVLYILTGIFYIFALYGLDVSILSPFFNIRTVFTVLIAAVFLNEILSLQQYALIGVLFVAGVFLTMDEKLSHKSFFRKPIMYALLAMICVSFESVFVKKSIMLNGYWETNLWTNVFGMILLLPTYFLFKKDIKTISIKKTWTMSLIAITGTIATLASYKAYEQNVSITSAILTIPVSMIIVIIFSFFKPHFLESHSIKVYSIRLTAAVIMIIAALMLSG